MHPACFSSAGFQPAGNNLPAKMPALRKHPPPAYAEAAAGKPFDAQGKQKAAYKAH